jgi:hypothetical protein
MPSKQVVDRQKSARAVIAAGETHAPKIAAELEALLAPHLHQGEQLPDIKLLAALVARSLAASTDQIIAADEAHLSELADDGAPRAARDETAAALYTTLVELREWLTALFGAAAVRALGFSSDTPRDPVALARFAGEIAGALTTAKLPKPKRPGVTWDAAAAAAEIIAARDTLNAHLGDVAREIREAQATVSAKNAALASYDERFTRAAGFYSGLFRLAGETELADRVRPSRRRPGTIEEADEATPEPSAETPPAT